MPNLIPAPSGPVALSGGSCTLPASLSVDHGPFAPWCSEAFFRRMGKVPADGCFLTLKKDPTLPSEGYRLQIRADGIALTAACESGIVQGLTTLFCLEKAGGIPLGTISDAPKYPHRGLSLDCARHFFPAEEVKKLIEHLSLHKINVLHWHLADDQGWRIESLKFPKLQEVSGLYYTQQEIREIVEFARIRGVEIIPEIDLPGHTTGILAAYPQYSCSEKEVELAAKGGIYPIILCAGKDSTFAFLKELLEEIVPLFPGKRFHMGGDEAPKNEWKACPHCKARMEQMGLKNYEELQGWFTKQICDILEPMGKTVICWNEILRGKAPQSLQIQYWTRQYQKAMEDYVPTGGEWIFSEMFDLYFDYPHSMNTLKKAHQVSPYFGSVKKGSEGNLLGLEGCLWSEHIAQTDHLERQIFPRMIALAEAGWTGKISYRGFRNRLKAIWATPLHQGLAMTAEESWDPSGKARLQQSLAYMSTMFAGVDTESAMESMGDSEENKDAMKAFYMGFITKFFKLWDLPQLLKMLKK